MTGSRGWDKHDRDWDGYRVMSRALAQVWQEWGRPADAVLVSGHCPDGADAMAESIWEWHDLTVERHPAKWGRYGRRAGLVRNDHMVSLGADLCLAFIAPCDRCRDGASHPSHGTVHCASAADAAGIPLRVVDPLRLWGVAPGSRAFTRGP